jgi:hypothetical protein
MATRAAALMVVTATVVQQVIKVVVTAWSGR